MAERFEITERPQTKELYMIAGWRQWADGGSVSSGLPKYLLQQTFAKKIGKLNNDGFFMFQLPGMHDFIRPVVKFEDGYPKSLETRRSELFYSGDSERGVVFFLGDEPHMDIDRYTDTLLDVAQELNVKRIIGLGGVYAELPYNKERPIGCVYSLPRMKPEFDNLAVDLSDYQGGASVGTYLCRKAGDRNMEYAGLYAFVPMYDFSAFGQRNSAIQIENDFMAWLGVMRRINYMLKTNFSLTDLEKKTRQLIETLDNKMEELDNTLPESGMREYMERLSEEFNETTFSPLTNVWEDALRDVLDEDSKDED